VKQHFVLTGFLLLAPLPALAQVTVNPAALQQLAGIAPPPPLIIETAAPVPVHHKPRAAHPIGWEAHGGDLDTIMALKSRLHPGTQPLKSGTQPVAPVQTAAHVPPPAPPKPGPAPIPVIAKPAGPATLTFGPDSDVLPANAAESLKPFCTAPGHVSVYARAPAVASDPSAALRLSLSRALAVQQALIACGVPEQNILPRALGAVPGQNEDEAVIGSGAK